MTPPSPADPGVDVLAKEFCRGWEHFTEPTRDALREGYADLLARVDHARASAPTGPAVVVQDEERRHDLAVALGWWRESEDPPPTWADITRGIGDLRDLATGPLSRYREAADRMDAWWRENDTEDFGTPDQWSSDLELLIACGRRPAPTGPGQGGDVVAHLTRKFSAVLRDQPPPMPGPARMLGTPVDAVVQRLVAVALAAPSAPGEAAELVAANEALGEALTEVGVILGLARPRPGATWGAREVIERAHAIVDMPPGEAAETEDEGDMLDVAWSLLSHVDPDTEGWRRARDEWGERYAAPEPPRRTAPSSAPAEPESDTAGGDEEPLAFLKASVIVAMIDAGHPPDEVDATAEQIARMTLRRFGDGWTRLVTAVDALDTESAASPTSGRPAAPEGTAGGDEIAHELRSWAEDIDNDCWSLAALPRVLRERADELATPREDITEEDPPEGGYRVHLDHCLRIVDLLWLHGWDGRADVVGTVRDALAASPRPVLADTETDPRVLAVGDTAHVRWLDRGGYHYARGKVVPVDGEAYKVRVELSRPRGNETAPAARWEYPVPRSSETVTVNARSAPVSGAAVPDGATAVGALIETVDELDRLPVGTVVRFVSADAVAIRNASGWSMSGIAPWLAPSMKRLLPVRVIDTPGAPSPLDEAATLLGCTPDQVPARVRGLLDGQRGGEA